QEPFHADAAEEDVRRSEGAVDRPSQPPEESRDQTGSAQAHLTPGQRGRDPEPEERGPAGHDGQEKPGATPPLAPAAVGPGDPGARRARHGLACLEAEPRAWGPGQLVSWTHRDGLSRLELPVRVRHAGAVARAHVDRGRRDGDHAVLLLEEKGALPA